MQPYLQARIPVRRKRKFEYFLQRIFSLSSEQQTSEEKKNPIDSTNSLFAQPAFLRSFEAELDKVDEYFQSKAPDVRQVILDSLQRMYNQNEWHDNPLTMICRDLDIPVSKLYSLFDSRKNFLLSFKDSNSWTIVGIKSNPWCFESWIWCSTSINRSLIFPMMIAYLFSYVKISKIIFLVEIIVIPQCKECLNPFLVALSNPIFSFVLYFSCQWIFCACSFTFIRSGNCHSCVCGCIYIYYFFFAHLMNIYRHAR